MTYNAIGGAIDFDNGSRIQFEGEMSLNAYMSRKFCHKDVSHVGFIDIYHRDIKDFIDSFAEIELNYSDGVYLNYCNEILSKLKSEIVKQTIIQYDLKLKRRVARRGYFRY